MLKRTTIGLLVLLTACSRPPADDNLYPVPTLVVAEGSTRGFDLSGYKRDPNTRLEVLPHPQVQVRFLPERDSLYLTPRSTDPGLVELPLLVDGQRAELLVRIQPMVRHTFTYRPPPGTQKVVVMGGFNDWSRTALPLADEDGDGLWERTVYLKPERHEYKFVVDGAELIDPANPDSVSNNLGGWNSVLDLTDRRPAPAGRYLKATRRSSRLYFHYLFPSDSNRPVMTLVLFNNQSLHPDRVDPRPDGSLMVNLRGLGNGLLRITGWDEQGRVLPENHTLIRDGVPLNPADHGDDWHFTVLYNLMVDRFLDGDPGNTRRVADAEVHPLANFHGGDFAGIIRKLEEGYFTDLGISAIWLSPVQRQPEGAYREWIPPRRKFTGYHGYWPVAPREIDPRFGTAAELERLVNLAHERGIKVILDLVTNHVHEEHPYFRDHRDWFGQVELPDGRLNIRNWSEETRLTTWFDIFLPSYDYPQAPAAIEQVVADALWWLETFNLDGFRQDAVKHVPHRFWRRLTVAMRDRFPEKDLYQIGETYGSDELILSYVNPGELSSQFNFAVYFNARGPFSADKADFTPLADLLENNLVTYQPVNLMGNISSSHDQVRFMAFADGQLSFSDNGTERAFTDPPGPVRRTTSYAKLANFWAFNLALPGVPVLYYGDEIGLMGAGDPDNRRPLRFGPDLNPEERRLWGEIARLNRLRRQLPALALGDLVPLRAEGPILALAKIYFNQVVVVVFNQSVAPREAILSLPSTGRTLTDLLGDEKIPVRENRATVTLPPYSHRFYRLER
jgi:glycosidase